MNGIALAWLGGMGLVTWRYIKDEHSPPAPGGLLVASGAFGVCALVGMANPTLGTLLAVGLDIAALLVVVGSSSGLTNSIGTAVTNAQNTLPSSASS